MSSDPASTVANVSIMADPVLDGLVVSSNPSAATPANINVANACVGRQTEALIARMGVIREHLVDKNHKIGNKRDKKGYQIGDVLVVKWDKINYHPGKGGGTRLKSLQFENKAGVVIGTT